MPLLPPVGNPFQLTPDQNGALASVVLNSPDGFWVTLDVPQGELVNISAAPAQFSGVGVFVKAVLDPTGALVIDDFSYQLPVLGTLGSHFGFDTGPFAYPAGRYLALIQETSPVFVPIGAVVSATENPVGTLRFTDFFLHPPAAQAPLPTTPGSSGGSGGSGGTVTITAADQTVALGAGPQTATNLGAGTVVVGGTGSDTILAVAGGGTYFGGPGQLVFINGSGQSTVVGVTGGGRDLINGGAGGGMFAGGPAGGNVLLAGAGTSTLFGAGSGDLLVASGSGADELVAGPGSETLSGGASTGANVLWGGAGSVLMGGGAGQETFIAGSGNATIIGGSGGDLYGFAKGLSSGGRVEVFGFNPAKGDAIALIGYTAGEVRADLASAVTSSAGTVIALSDSTQIAFVGVSGLTATNFV